MRRIPPLYRLLPRSLFGQVVLATVVAVAVSQLLGAAILIDERARTTRHLWGEAPAQRVGAFIRAIDEAAPDDRRRLIDAGVRPGHASLEDPWRPPGLKLPPEAVTFIATLKRELDKPIEVQVVLTGPDSPGGPGGPFLPGAAGEAFGPRRPGGPPGGSAGVPEDGAVPTPRPPPPALMEPPRPHGHLIVQARLSDGSVLTLRQTLPPPLGELPARVLMVLALLTIVAGGLAVWAVRRVTSPLGSMARAAAGLANNLDQAPLPESGPVEVATAAVSFNRMQRELKRMLETRSQALAAVSHDLRLPITRIRLRIERIADEATREAIDTDLQEMDRMIGETLEFLRAGASTEQPARIDVNALVESLTEDMRAMGCDVRQHGAAGAPLLARGQALRRCLGNILENARRYGAGPVDFTLRDDAGSVSFVVEDRGPGIPEADRERVFEPFVRLESSRARHTGGTGLGLAIARAIARGHGGDARLEGREGGGLRVVLRFPRRA